MNPYTGKWSSVVSSKLLLNWTSPDFLAGFPVAVRVKSTREVPCSVQFPQQVYTACLRIGVMIPLLFDRGLSTYGGLIHQFVKMVLWQLQVSGEKKKKEATVYIIQATIICRPWFDFVLIISSFDKRCPCFFSISVLDFLLHHPNLLFLNEWRRRKTSLTWLTPSRLPSLDSFCFFTAPDTKIDYTFFVAWQQDETFLHAFATGSRRLTPPLITLFPCSATTLILLFPNSPFALAYFCFEFCSALPIRFRNCLVYSRLVAGLHVTSRRHCWWSTTKAFLSSGK